MQDVDEDANRMSDLDDEDDIIEKSKKQEVKKRISSFWQNFNIGKRRYLTEYKF